MATGLIEGALVGDAVAKISDAIIQVVKKTAKFKSNLIQLQGTISRIKPIFDEMEKLNNVLDRPKQETYMFISQLEGGEELVRKCESIKWNVWKRYRHSCKLEDLDQSLLRFFQFDVQLQQARDTKEVLVVVKEVQNRMEKLSISGFSAGVPLLKGVVIGFKEQLVDLKAMVLKDAAVDDCSVVVVSAAGGCGKTTLVTMLCHDPDIHGKFGGNIYFVTVSNTPNLKVIVNNLLWNNQAGQQLNFNSDEDAIHQWGHFLGGVNSEILLILDDVWCDSIIKAFKFRKPGYKILVTSRFSFTQFPKYELKALNDQDALTLFRHSAFPEGVDELIDIPTDLIRELVKSCKKHPLALCVIGGSLSGKHVVTWRSILKLLSEKQQSVLDLDKDMLLRLGKSLDVLDGKPEVKQCYLDLGLFPEDHRIPASTLMDMWVHLYKHDEEGMASLTNLLELSFRNLATLLPIRKDSSMISNYCEEKFVMQHDMLRELAIHMSSQGPETERKRLIINVKGANLPKWTEQLQRPVNASLLSISTDEAFLSRWNNMQVPEVEVLVLNLMSKTYSLPAFMGKINKLKVLIVTNYGLYPTKVEKFPASGCLSGLTTIRLKHVSVSSIGKSILELVNLQKLSLIMCEIGNGFDEFTLEIPRKLPNLTEIEVSYCHELVEFPKGLCNLTSLRKLSFTNCNELGTLSERLGNLTNLEVLSLNSCTKLARLPESIGNLQKLNTLDISECLLLSELPMQIGKLSSLSRIHMKGCSGLELPQSVENLRPLEVVCDEEVSKKWSGFPDVTINLVEEDKFGNFSRIRSDLFL